MTTAPTTTRPPPGPPRARPALPPPANNTAQPQTNGTPKLGLLPPKFQPPRVILIGVEGWGKTSTIAYADGAAIAMAAGETGYETLLGAGRVPQIPAVKLATWAETLAFARDLVGSQAGPKVLGFDAMGGFERMCFKHVVDRDFKGEWGDKGFGSYQKGPGLAVTDWLMLLVELDRLRQKHGTAIVLLAHSTIARFADPTTADYDRFTSDLNKNATGPVTTKWVDAVLFGQFYTVVEGGSIGDTAKGQRPKKGKAIGGTDRILYTEHRATWDAKNRYGMPEVLDIPGDPAQVWTTIINAMQKGSE